MNLQSASLLSALALVLWQYRAEIMSFVKSFMGSKPAPQSSERIDAVRHLEAAEAIAERLGYPNAAGCCRHACRALYGDGDSDATHR